MLHSNRSERTGPPIDDLDTEQELKAELRNNRLYKYLFVGTLAAGMIGVISWDPLHRIFDLSAVNKDILSAALTGLVLSFIYDIFTHRQTKLESALEVRHLAQSISKRLMSGYDPLVLPDDQLKTFLTAAVADSRSLKALSEAISDSPEIQDQITRSYWEPVWNGALMRNVRVRNRLKPASTSARQYRWEMRQTFRWSRATDRFRCVVTSENAIVNALAGSRDHCDLILLLSNHAEGVSVARNELKLSLSVELIREGHRKRVILPSSRVEYDRMSNVGVWQEHWRDDVIVEDYLIPTEYLEREFLLELETLNSLDDPYFYASQDNPIICDEIEIDYSEIRALIGGVSILNMINAQGVSVDHAQADGRVIARVNGLLWPGQGIAIIWRPK